MNAEQDAQLLCAVDERGLLEAVGDGLEVVLHDDNVERRDGVGEDPTGSRIRDIDFPSLTIQIANAKRTRIGSEKIPRNILEASSDLGAGQLRTFLNVVVPLSLPGFVTGFIFAFIIALGDYIIPIQLGGTQGIMYDSLI